jgi:hypothetical protein
MPPLLPCHGDSLFSKDVDPQTTAELGWIGMGTQAAYADGYREAGDIVVDAVVEGRLDHHPDHLFYPVAYLYRHSLELRLKLVIAAASYHMTGEVDFGWLHKTHDLQKLWDRAKQQFLEARPDADGEPIEAAGRVISELHSIDERSTALRYPLTKDAKKHNLKGTPRQIELAHFKTVIGRVSTLLDGCLAMIEEAMSEDGGQVVFEL